MKQTIVLIISFFILSCSSLNEITKNNNKLAYRSDHELYALAKSDMNRQKFKESIDSFIFLLEEFEDTEYKADSYFAIAYLSKTFVNDKETAKKYFNKLITEFPDSDIAKSAEFELNNIDNPDAIPELK
ncbi:MAG: hypothetical protein JXR48_00315 [Candidatus Delongbacteria bacterium]|nr:hypothetical protein [Candidatus Delongbacteria bacterium]MBN2833387.1 hypothetical protein [Candidatus Delongbacteria bacterium]